MKEERKELIYQAWGAWILILGIIMIITIVLPEITSIHDYLQAFLINRPELSWCPTFLMLYGICAVFKTKWPTMVFGMVLLPLGIIVTATGFMYGEVGIFPHVVHLSELATGILTVYRLKKVL